MSKPKPAATPQAQATPAPSSASIGGVTFTAPTGSGSGGDLYGLGAWGGQTIDASGFPIQLTMALSQALATKGPDGQTVNADLSNVTGAQLAKALEGLTDPDAIGQLQQILYYSGYYPSSVTSLSDLDLGRVTAADETAIKTALVAGARAGQPVGSYLTQQANSGFAQGVVNNSLKQPSQLPSQADEDYVLRSEATSLLGHEPSPQLLAGFKAWRDKTYKQAYDAAHVQIASQVGVPLDQLGQAYADLGLNGYSTPMEGPPSTFARSAAPVQGPPLPGHESAAETYAGASSGSASTLDALNNAYGDYQTRMGADKQIIDQANAAMGQTPADVRDVDDPNAAAAEYLRANAPGQIAAQNVATKYGTLLQILGGGS